MRDLWGGTYREPAVWEETAQALIASADLREGMRVLDVGSAGGGTLFPALDRIGETGSILGIEIDEEWVEWLRDEISRRGIRNAESLLMNGQSMSFPDASFDAVIMGMVGLGEQYDFDAGRIIDDAPLMREVFRVLRPGHFLYNSNWLRQDDDEWMGDLIRLCFPSCAKCGYSPGTPEGYVDLIEAVGFEDVRVTPFEGKYTFEDPAEWVACVRHVWEEELEQIKADPDVLHAFERRASDLLASHFDEDGRLAYTRSAVLVSARKPGGR